MALQGRMIPCHRREAVITVESYNNGIMRGSLRHPRLQKKEGIQSLSQLILILNSLMDLESCPNRPLPLISSEGGNEDGAAVFRIQILFREHYTWQGRMVWQNENQEVVFHSAMELLQLLDEILAE